MYNNLLDLLTCISEKISVLIQCLKCMAEYNILYMYIHEMNVEKPKRQENL